MDYIFDTDAIVAFYDDTNQEKHTNIHNKVLTLGVYDNVYVSVLSLYEYHYSYSNAAKKEKDKILTTINELEKDFQILPVGNIGASIFGELKAKYKAATNTQRSNMKKFNIDLIIASTAISNSCIVVSNDKVYKKLSEICEDFECEQF